MSDEIEGCECGFRATRTTFKKTKGSCPVDGKPVLDGAEQILPNALASLKAKLPRRGQ